MALVSVVRLEPTFIAAVRHRTTFAALPREIRSYFDVVYAAVRDGAVKPFGHDVAVKPFGHDVAIYRNASEHGVDVECGVRVATKFADVGPVECRELPRGEAATTTHWGAYQRLAEAHDRVTAWAAESGRLLAGVVWEVYGDWDDDPAKVRTDVYHLLKPV
jgi:effector-binding domain-containing protein